MLNKLLEHHVLANLTFLLVLVIGWLAYFQLPREQDPSVNLNWVQVWTHWPGASAIDVEKRVTEPLEEGLKRLDDVRYISSVSRENISSILVRFNDLDRDDFDQRIADLRRELLARMDELPADVRQPDIFEVNSANFFPMASVVVSGTSGNVALQRRSKKILEDFERMDGVDKVLKTGASDPELQVNFRPDRLIGLGVSPADLADSVSAYFRDLAAGKLIVGDQKWLVRLAGTSSDPSVLARFPIVTATGEVPLRAVADIDTGIEDPQELVRFDGSNAILLSILKKEKANNLELLARVKKYIQQQNRLSDSTGITLTLMDDRTSATRNAIGVMESNALIGLILVVATVGAFLGWRIALIASIGIPFVLAGTFLTVLLLGETLNTTVLLAIVISLGMLVDDAIVVVESIHFHLGRGAKPLQAARLALHEVALPVSSAVFTTIAAFLPLILMPGVLGDFMRVVPLVVTIALLLSLVEAFWMLPAHMISLQPRMSAHGRLQRWRRQRIHAIQRRYVALLTRALRWPKLSLASGVALLTIAVLAVAMGAIKVDFFASDLYRLFYVNVDMPAGTSLQKTMDTVVRAERIVADKLGDNARGIVAYAGQQFTDKEILAGDERGQVFVSLATDGRDSRSVDQIIDELRPALLDVAGPRDITFVRRQTGPPTTKPISIKVRGSDIAEIRAAVDAVKATLRATRGVSEIQDDDFPGANELMIRLNPDAITRARVHPERVARFLRLFATGEKVASMQFQGEKLSVRVRAAEAKLDNIGDYLNYPVSLPEGGEIALGELLLTAHQRTESNIRHQDFRRAVTVEAEIDPAVIDTIRANAQVASAWRNIASDYPGVSLDFSGELDDIQESLGSMAMLFLFGIGLIYLILSAQFRSYTQPLIIMAVVPMAFVGVVFGLGISGNPLSLFTLYGLVALAGIAANDAIVLISTANTNRGRTGKVVGSVVRAARRRLLPILITSVTTVAGLVSLATGLGGHSLMWGPVATAIVWGLAFSTVLTLFIVPVLYAMSVSPLRQPQLLAEDLLPAPAATTGLRRIAQMILSRIPRRSESQGSLARILTDPESGALYNQAVAAIENQDLETPIRCFEQLARRHADSLELNILAAQANIRWMQLNGWDIGYSARARRFIQRARLLGPSDNRVAELKDIFEQIEEQKPEEDD